MKKTKHILFFLLLFCGVLACVDGKTNVKNATTNNEVASEKNWLKELRTKVRILFPDVIEYDQISPKYFEKGENYNVFRVKFSNIIYESDGKFVKVPIFCGTMKDVLYDDFLEYCEKMGLIKDGSWVQWLEPGRKKYVEDGFEVKFEKGEYKKVFNEFRKFYESSLSIDFREISMKSSPYSEKEQISVYDFILDGIDGEFSFYRPYPEYEDEATKLEYSIKIR